MNDYEILLDDGIYTMDPTTLKWTGPSEAMAEALQHITDIRVTDMGAADGSPAVFVIRHIQTLFNLKDYQVGPTPVSATGEERVY